MALGVTVQQIQTLLTYLPYLALVIIAKLLLQSFITSILNRFRSDIEKIPAEPLPLWKCYTVGHNLAYLVLRTDAFDVAALFNSWRKTYGPIFQVRSIFGERNVMITSETAIRQVNISRQSSFVKADSSRRFMAPIVGDDGLLLAEGENHARLRRAVAPAMHHRALAAIGDVFLEQGEQLAERIGERANQGGDVMNEVRSAAFAVIIIACLGRDAVSPQVVNRLHESYSVIFPEPPLQTLRNQVLGSLFWFIDKKHFSYRQDLKNYIWQTIEGICAERVRQCESGTNDGEVPLVSLMFDTDKQKHISSTEMIQTLMSFMIGGQLTSSISVVWTLYLLAREPQWQDKLLAHLKEWSQQDGLDGLDRIDLFDRIIRESIRLYPPIFITSRKTTEAVEVDGFKIPSNTNVRVPILAIHRNEDIWGTDVHEFNPDRFLDNSLVARTKMLWCPFSFGSRGCIGQRFALLEAKAFVGQIILRQRVYVKPTEDAAPTCVGPFAIPSRMKLYFEPR